jgi:hypothetical protein
MTNKPQIAKLYVQDEEGNVVGTFVVDIESIVEMYVRRMKGEMEPPSDETAQDQMKTGLIRRATNDLGWYRHTPGGKLELAFIPLDDRI